MHDGLRIPRWLAPILFVCATSALATNYRVGVDDDCSFVCFRSPVIVHVGDTVTFYAYPDQSFVYPLTVAADDGSFRYDMVTFDGHSFHVTPESTPIAFDAVATVPFHVEPAGQAGVIYVLAAAPAAISTIGNGITGTWFNSAQSGMGFMLEVLPGSPMQLLASWLTFSPQGGPSWIVGVGPIGESRATLQATQIVGSGARFPPNFDPANVQTQSWGALTFTFSDCNHGHVDWASAVPGYGKGGFDLTRLTQPAGLPCPRGVQ